jgi:hypothetical protein
MGDRGVSFGVTNTGRAAWVTPVDSGTPSTTSGPQAEALLIVADPAGNYVFFAAH